MVDSSQVTKSAWPVLPGVMNFDDRINEKSFLDFVGRANMMLDTSYQPVFAHLIIQELRRRHEPEVLDIGCGSGIGRRTEYTRLISTAAGRLWGIEPDESIEAIPDLFYRFQHAMLEDADLPSDQFDVAYASFVMEHVADPQRFLATVHRVLKPGGSFLFLTPNASAFFGRICRLLNRVRLDESMLHMIKRAPEKHAYHYPIVSRCNRVSEVESYAEQAGFLPPEFAFFQFAGCGGYFPGPFKLFYRLLLTKRRLLKNPRALDSMVCRLVKPS